MMMMMIRTIVEDDEEEKQALVDDWKLAGKIIHVQLHQDDHSNEAYRFGYCLTMHIPLASYLSR